MFWKKSAPGLVPEWMIVGLGNPGPEYRGTRHNVGFEVIDALSEKFKIRVDKSKHRSRYGIGRVGETACILVKPLTFMNLSGQAVAPLCRDHSILPEKVLVIADDLDLPVGKVRLRESGSAGGHNGHKSLIQHLKTQDYPRVKIGVGKVDKSGTVDHVLGSFTPEERVDIDRAIKTTVQAIVEMLNNSYLGAQAVIDRER